MDHVDVDVEAVGAQLDEQGYCVLPAVIEPAEADRVRGIVAGLCEAEQTDEHREKHCQRVGRIAVKDRVFVELMCHPVICAIWKHWLAPDAICSTWTSNTLYPGHGEISWHADYPYWSMQTPWPRGRLAGQTIWMLDDFTEANGGTGIVPYSPRKCCPPEKPKEWREDGMVVTGTRGSVLVMDGLMWHTARPNISEGSRSCLLGMYTLPCCVAMEDMRGQLAEIAEPTDEVTQLMGGNQYVPADVVG